jgi:hypothetical protein
MLEHFSVPIWPRNVSTAATRDGQRTIEDEGKQRALLYYNGALTKDCRIAIYRNFERMQETGAIAPEFRSVPDHIFIDIDLKAFSGGDMNLLNAALKATLRRMKQQLNGAVPTVLWSGGGYHIHQPLQLEVAFEGMPDFKRFENPSVKFMRYAARRLSAHSDPNHNVSFKSCMARVPGSINSKYEGETTEVKIVQRWDSIRAKPSKQFMVTDFLIALVEKEVVDKAVVEAKNVKKYKNVISYNSTTTPWIECLLGTPIDDMRRNARDLILIPYLVVRRGLGPDQVYNIVMEWADKCGELRSLQPSRRAYSDRVRTRIQEVVRDRVPPMTWSRFQEMQPEMAELVGGCKRLNIDHNYAMTNMTQENVNINENDNEFGNESDTQVPQNDMAERKELSPEELSLMDIITHKYTPTCVLDFNKDPKKRIEAKHTFDVKKGPVPLTYFPVTLPEDPGYERYYRVTSTKLRRAIINRYLKKDKTRLEINRIGSNQQNTVYKIRAVDEDRVLVITSQSESFEQVAPQQQHL